MQNVTSAPWCDLLAMVSTIQDRCFVEVRRRTRSMVCVVNVQKVERRLDSIFTRLNLE